MKIFTLCLKGASVLFLLLICHHLSAQELSVKTAIDLIKSNAISTGLSGEEIDNGVVTDAYFNKSAGTKMVYLQQAYKEVAVFNVLKVFAFKEDKLVSAQGDFIDKIQSRINAPDATPRVTDKNAVMSAAGHLNLPISQNINAINTLNNGRTTEFGTLGISLRNIKVQLLWVPLDNGSLKLAWQVNLQPVKSSDDWLINIDALTGEFINKENLTVYCDFTIAHNHDTDITDKIYKHEVTTPIDNAIFRAVDGASYRVVKYPFESLKQSGGVQALVVNPWEAAGQGNAATSFGWHYDGGVQHDSTRGNNVWAKDDTLGNNVIIGRSTVSGTSQPSLTFDYSFDTLITPLTPANQRSAATNLFYWNNVIHDIIYQYGFDEVSGNFQNFNSDRGGLGVDYVLADCQDGSGFNNANFSTPVDGSRPRMQMFLWNPSPKKTFKLNTPIEVAGFKLAPESNFSTMNKLVDIGPVSGNVILYLDPIAGTYYACDPAANTAQLAGNIALIDRGICTAGFIQKVKNAQNAGAIAAIMVNNVGGDPTAMGGTDNTITIPAVMISMADGNEIKGFLGGGNPVNVTLNKPVNMDGDFDNGIIVHEYGHGISNRLTGGPATTSCLGNAEQMGEGWSDFYALMLTTNWATAQLTDNIKRRPIGTYVNDQHPEFGRGIRNFPYSTSMSINPQTYATVLTLPLNGTSTPVHAIGSIWCTVLWDLVWKLIEIDGIHPNLYNASGLGGNINAMKLVTEAMKLQACRPGFVDGRNAILKADSILFNGKYSCAIWSTFSRRGLGYNASQGSSNIYTDGVADFTNPASALIVKQVNKANAAPNEQVVYTLKVINQCSQLYNFKVVDTLPANATYVSGGSYNAANRTVTFNVAGLPPSQTATYSFIANINNNSYYAPSKQFEDVITPVSLNTTFAAATNGTATNIWMLNTTRFKSAPSSLKSTNPATATTQTLTTVSSYPIVGHTTLSFWHYFNTEKWHDGGVVEISADNGVSWIDAGTFMRKNPYNSTLTSNNSLSNIRGFSGLSSGTGTFIETSVNLTSFSGSSVMFRFRYVTDVSTAADGWYIDDVVLRKEAAVYNNASLFNGSNELQGQSDTLTLISDPALPIVLGNFYAEKINNTAFLKWSALQTINASRFVIQRSNNGISFTDIGSTTVPANSNVTSNYNFTDVSPGQGKNYYRLKLVDLDNRTDYSAVRTLVFSGSFAVVTISPNPAKGNLTISIPGNVVKQQVYLISAEGQRVYSFMLNGANTLVDLPALPAGVYFIRLLLNNSNSIHKIVIE